MAKICKMSYWSLNLCIDFLCYVLLKCFSFWEVIGELFSYICIVLYKNRNKFCDIVKKLTFEKSVGRNTNIKFTEYSPYGSKVVPFWRTDMTKLLVFFAFSNTPKNKSRVTVKRYCVLSGPHLYYWYYLLLDCNV